MIYKRKQQTKRKPWKKHPTDLNPTDLILKMRYAIYFQTEDIRGVLKNTFQIEDNIS